MVYDQKTVDEWFRQQRIKFPLDKMMQDPDKAVEMKTEENRKKVATFDAVPDGISIEKIPFDDFNCFYLHSDKNPADKVVYYIHGGGFSSGSSAQRTPFICYCINTLGYNVFSVDYRLAPEFKAPTALNDCLTAYKYLLTRFDSKKIALFGESAGGNLVLTTIITTKDEGLKLPACIIANSPACQLEEYTKSWYDNDKKDNVVYIGALPLLRLFYCDDEKLLKDGHIMPKYADFTGMPPVWLDASDSECLLDDSLLINDLMKKAGCEVTLKIRKNMMHAYLISPSFVEVGPMLLEIKEYIDKKLGA